MSSKKILLVEDEQEIVEMIQMALEARGYEVMAAYDGSEGLRMATEKKPDLILLDIIMPGLNGYQVCRELKNHPSTRETPIIYLTAKGQETDKFWGFETGAAEYIVKPFEMGDLIEKMEEALQEGG